MIKQATADPQYERIKRELEDLEPQDTVEVSIEEFGEPRDTWVPTILGIPYRDTRRQWRDGVVHIHETRKSTYRFHRDRFDPKEAPVKHMVFDAPRTLSAVIVTAGLGLGLVGRLMRRRFGRG